VGSLWHGRESYIAFIVRSLRQLLEIIDLEVQGSPVRVDGFKLRSVPPETDSPVHDLSGCLDLKGIGRFEPRLEYIANQLAGLLKAVELLSAGRPVAPTGFRLKKLAHWVRYDPYHHDPYTAVLQYLSWPCQTRCEFCLHQGDPPGTYTKSPYGWMTSIQEIKTRLKYWDPEARQSLPAKSEYNFYETLTHPRFKAIARAVRDKTRRPFTLVTSGNPLSTEMIDFLSSVAPVFLGVSLNSKSAQTRVQLMNDRDPVTSVESLARLREKQLPYFVSVTAFDAIEIEEIIQTIRWADRFDPYFIRINLDAHTRYSPVRRNLKTSMAKWRQIVASIRRIREDVDAPIIFQPAMMEERFFMKKNRLIVEGVVKNSPAWDAGLRAMDEIVSIGGIPIAYRTHARQLLHLHSVTGVDGFTLEYLRKGKPSRVTINGRSTSAAGPYRSEGIPVFQPYGILMRAGLDPDQLVNIGLLAQAHRAKKVLILTSELVKPSLKALIKENEAALAGLDLFLEVPGNRVHFGGDIVLGDLLVADDFTACITSWVRKRAMKPDLVIVPSTPFNSWGRDLTGKPYLAIEREASIPVEILTCERIQSLN
jgi:hypothetical protein